MDSMKVFYVCLFLGLAVAQSPFKDCGSKDTTIKSVDVSGCTSQPCKLTRNTNVSVTVNFTANTDITSATTKIYAFVSGVKVPYPVPDANACDFMKCPVKSGTEEDYKYTMFIKKSYPKITLIVQWEIYDADGDMAVCFSVPAQVV